MDCSPFCSLIDKCLTFISFDFMQAECTNGKIVSNIINEKTTFISMKKYYLLGYLSVW